MMNVYYVIHKGSVFIYRLIHITHLHKLVYKHRQLATQSDRRSEGLQPLFVTFTSWITFYC